MGCIYSNNKGDNKCIQINNPMQISKDINPPFHNFFDLTNIDKSQLNPQSELNIQGDDLLFIDVNNKDNNTIHIDGKSRNLNQMESEGNNVTEKSNVFKVSTNGVLSSILESKSSIKTKSLTLFLKDSTSPIPSVPLSIKLTRAYLIDSKGYKVDKPFQQKEIRYTFGKEDRNSTNQIVDYIINDQFINTHQFDIILDSNNNFFIQEFENSTGIYYKLNKKVKIPNNKGIIITFSNVYILLKSQDRNNNTLSVTFIDQTYKNKHVMYCGLVKKIVKLGRSKDVDIILNKGGVSRTQWTAVYKNNNWWLFDGNMEISVDDENNPIQNVSTNGIWVQIDGTIELQNGKILKTGQTVIDLKIEE